LLIPSPSPPPPCLFWATQHDVVGFKFKNWGFVDCWKMQMDKPTCMQCMLAWISRRNWGQLRKGGQLWWMDGWVTKDGWLWKRRQSVPLIFFIAQPLTLFFFRGPSLVAEAAW
jgi:hypothetical protein